MKYRLVCTSKYIKEVKRIYKENSFYDIFKKLCSDDLIDTYSRDPKAETELWKVGLTYVDFEKWYWSKRYDEVVAGENYYGEADLWGEHYTFAKEKGITIPVLTEQDYFNMIWYYLCEDYTYEMYEWNENEKKYLKIQHEKG